MRSNAHRRRAGMYVAVLGAATLVAVIGLSALTLARIQHRTGQGTSDQAEARLYARSAIEMGLFWMNGNPDWRTGFPNGAWATNKPIGNGSFTLEGIDRVDADLANSDSDSLDLVGTGFKGDAQYKLQVTLEAQGGGLTCLEVALHADNDLVFDDATVHCDQTISANNSVIASDSEIDSDVEAVNAITGGTYWRAPKPPITPRNMPDPATVFESYKTNGTWIPISSVPTDSGIRTISETAISPTNNPYGDTTTNDDGIYVIDCLNQDLQLRNCRIVGTLVLLNAGTGSSMYGSMNWQPAISNYPALLVSGSFSFDTEATALSESSISVDFNEDSDMVDTYPSVIKGLVYVSGDVAVTNTVNLQGTLVVGVTLTATGPNGPATADLNLTYSDVLLNNPPPGFGEVAQMVISPGTWRQVVN